MKPIFSIWVRPLKTFEFLANRDEVENDNKVNTLFFLTSMTTGFANATDINILIGGNYYVSLAIALVVSGLVGLFMWTAVFSTLIHWISKIFQGQSTKDEIQLTLAYSLVPNLVNLAIGLVLIIPAIILDNKDLIKFSHPIITFGLWLFTIRALVYGLSYFNKYKYVYAILTILIPAAILQGILFGLKNLIG